MLSTLVSANIGPFQLALTRNRHDKHDQVGLCPQNRLLGPQERSSSSVISYASSCIRTSPLDTDLIASSDEKSSTIRIYDGRGDGTPLQTISSLHRAPVHLMTVSCPQFLFPDAQK
jgi:hypothetical protein